MTRLLPIVARRASLGPTGPKNCISPSARGGGANSGEGDNGAGRCEFQEVAREREHLESPLEWLFKVILSIQEILLLAQIRAVAIATTPPNKVQQNQWAPLDHQICGKFPRNGVFQCPAGLDWEALRYIDPTPPGQLRCVCSELEVQAWPIGWMLWVRGIAFTVGRIAEATAVGIGEWGMAGAHRLSRLPASVCRPGLSMHLMR